MSLVAAVHIRAEQSWARLDEDVGVIGKLQITIEERPKHGLMGRKLTDADDAQHDD